MGFSLTFGGVFSQYAYLDVFELYLRKYAYLGHISAYLTLIRMICRNTRIYSVFSLYLPVLGNTVPAVQIHVRYATDTRITAESDLGPGMVNVFGVEYGFNSVR